MELPGPGAIVADKYEVEGVLGEGAMGVVLAARHRMTGKPVAIKWVIAPHGKVGRARVLAEAKNAGRIHHPNVVDIYDYGETDDAVYLVMERLVGIPLSDRPEGPMTSRDAARLMLPILRGIAAAHAGDVLHRDIKPANIFLCQDSTGRASTVKIVDFGISKLLAPDATNITRAGSVLGTPAYMAPEQFRGEELDHRCDQYALGCVLYELLEGEDPFDVEEMSELVSAKMSGTVRPFAQLVPARMQSVVRRAMHPDRRRRFESIGAFGAALEPFAEGKSFSDTDADWSGVFPVVAAEIPVPLVDAPERRSVVPLWLEVVVAVGIFVLVGVVAYLAAFDEDLEESVPVSASTALPEPDRGVDPPVTESSTVISAMQTAAEEEAESEAEVEVESEAESEAEPETPRMRRPRMVESMHRTGMLTLEDF